VTPALPKLALALVVHGAGIVSTLPPSQ
jgi:hypothetical protein